MNRHESGHAQGKISPAARQVERGLRQPAHQPRRMEPGSNRPRSAPASLPGIERHTAQPGDTRRHETRFEAGQSNRAVQRHSMEKSSDNSRSHTAQAASRVSVLFRSNDRAATNIYLQKLSAFNQQRAESGAKNMNTVSTPHWQKLAVPQMNLRASSPPPLLSPERAEKGIGAQKTKS